MILIPEPSSYFTQIGGRTIIEQNIEQLEQVQAAWDTRWAEIFEGTSGLYLGVCEFANIIFVGTFLFFSVLWVKEALERGIFPALPNVIWVFVVGALLFNNAALLRSNTLGIRNLINDQTQNVLEVALGEISMREALNDVIVTQQAKKQIQQLYAECEAKEGQAQIDCFVEAGANARQMIDEYADQGWLTTGVRRLRARVEAINDRIQQAAEAGNSLASVSGPDVVFLEGLITSATQALSEQILKGFQWAFANILELSMLLTALMGPIAIAGSAIPLQGRSIWAWLTGFFSLGIAKFSYNVIVGLAATVVVTAEAQDTNTIGFLFLMAVLAPVLALSLAAGGGMTVFRGVSGGVTRLVSVSSSYLPVIRL